MRQTVDQVTHGEESSAMRVLLVGTDAALLEGLAQTLAALGHIASTAESLHEAREAASAAPPLMAAVERTLAAESGAAVLAIPLAPGGAVVLYHHSAEDLPGVAPALQRAVMADLTLPLERNRLIALVQHVGERARATGRGHRITPPEQQAF